MPRLMAVSLTENQVRDRTKTVTRRLGWLMLKPGDTVTLCEKVQGLRTGKHPVRITGIEVVTPEDVAAEGFPAGASRSSSASSPAPQGLRAQHRSHPLSSGATWPEPH